MKRTAEIEKTKNTIAKQIEYIKEIDKRVDKESNKLKCMDKVH